MDDPSEKAAPRSTGDAVVGVVSEVGCCVVLVVFILAFFGVLR